MRAILDAERPDDGILGEEEAAKPGTSGLTWVLDPIDGTRGFISGTPTCGVLISLADENGPILGAIDQPFMVSISTRTARSSVPSISPTSASGFMVARIARRCLGR